MASDKNIFGCNFQNSNYEMFNEMATERHLWLNLSNIKGKDKNFLMDAPISSSSHLCWSLCSWESWREFAGTGFYYFSLPAVAGQSMVPRYHIPSRRASSGAPHQEGTSVPSRGLDISPPTRTVETVGLASEGAQLIDSGLSTEVVETILNLRALKWRVFTSLCSDHQLDPVNCPVGTVLEFLQERFTAGLAPFTLKLY